MGRENRTGSVQAGEGPSQLFFEWALFDGVRTSKGGETIVNGSMFRLL